MSVIMATPSKKKSDAAPEKKSERTGYLSLNAQVDEDVRKQLDLYIEFFNKDEANIHKATLRTTLEAALKAFLKAQGYWPPKQS